MSSQPFAEHQDSAPEFMDHSQATSPSPGKLGYYHGSETRPQSDYTYPSAGGGGEAAEAEKPKRKLLGLAPWMIFVLVALALLVVAGVVLGAVLGTRHSSHSGAVPASPAETTSPSSPTTNPAASPSSTKSATPSSTPTSLAIIDAVYAAVNVTAEVEDNVMEGEYIIVNMAVSGGSDPWGGADEWVNVKKCLGLLHSFGSSIRTFVACDSDGSFTLIPGDIGLEPQPNTHEITRQGPSSANFAIVSVVWGAAEIRDESVYQTLYDYKTNGSAVPFENWLFGVDTLVGWAKSGVVWYTEDDFATFKRIMAREGGSIAF